MNSYDLETAARLDTVHRIKLVFQRQEYKATFIVNVGGNSTGMFVIEDAISLVLDHLPVREFEDPYIILRSDDGKELRIDHCTSENNYSPLDEPFLMGILVSADLLAVTDNGGVDEAGKVWQDITYNLLETDNGQEIQGGKEGDQDQTASQSTTQGQDRSGPDALQDHE